MTEDRKFSVVDAINNLEEEEVTSWVESQLEKGVSPHEIVDDLTVGLERLGERFEAEEAFIPELVLGGEIFTRAMELLRPAIEESGKAKKKVGTILLGTVAGDLHDLGKNLVAVTFVAAGFEVVNLGTDVPTMKFVEEVERTRPDIVGMSALLTTTMEKQREVIDALDEAGLRSKVKTLVGGAVANQEWADEIGADAYGGDAIDALRKAKVLLGHN